MPMRNRIFGIFVIAFALLAAGVAPARCKELKINLVMGDGTIMMYFGSNDGVKVGDKFTVMRNDKEIGSIEVTRVEPTYSVAKVVATTDEIREMDLVVRPILGAGLSGASGMKSGDETTTEPVKKDDKKAAEKADGKEEKKAKAEKKPSAKKTTKKEDTKKESKKEDTGEDSKDEKDKSTSKSKTDTKSADTKDAATEQTQAAKPDKTIRDIHFPSIGGAVGLYQMPTAFVADAGSGGVSIFAYKDSNISSGTSYGGTELEEFSYNLSTISDTKAISFAYAFNSNIEISGAQITRDVSITANASDYFNTIQASASAKIKATVIGVKFNPRKKFLLKSDTHKDFQYAFGVQNMSVSGDGEGSTDYYAAVAFPTKKIIFHGNVYRSTGGAPGAKKWGSMFGLEAPITRSAAFIADMDRFNGDATYVLGLRYLFSDRAALSLGFHDVTESNATLLNGSILF